MAEAKLQILRQNPALGIEPHYETFTVPVGEDKTTVMQALEYIFNNLDQSLAFRRYSCGLQFCNSCLMKVNGKTARACLTIVPPGATLRVEPLDGKVVKDLIPEG